MWEQKTRDEQAAFISNWIRQEGRLEFLDESPVDILQMVADLYDPDFLELNKNISIRMAEIGKMVCAAMAACAVKSARRQDLI